MRGTRSKVTTALLITVMQLPILAVAAYLAAQFTVTAEREDQEEYEQQFVMALKESVRNEARTNAQSIEKWNPKLVEIAQDLQDFVNNKGPNRPGVDPGYGSLMVSALRQLSESPVAVRHLLPCVHAATGAMLDRLVEANDIKREVDTALVEYTATFPGSLPDTYTAAARLHARIEHVLYVYKNMPDYLAALDQSLDAQNCEEEIESQKNS